MLSLVASLFVGGTNAAFAQAVTYSFEDEGALPEGWEINNTVNSWGAISIVSNRAHTGTYSMTSTYNGGSGKNNYVVVPMVEGTVSIWYRAYQNNDNGLLTIYKYEDGALGAQLAETSRKSSTYTEYTLELEEATQIAIAIGGLSIDDITLTYASTTDAPNLVVNNPKGNKMADGDTYAFGLVDGGTTADFVLSNKGTQALTINSITATGGFGVNTITSIPAKEQATLTVTMPAETAAGVITIATAELGDFTFNVSSTVKDPSKSFVNFAGLTKLPEGWDGSSNWTIVGSGSGTSSNGGYAGNDGMSKYEIHTGMMTFEENEPLIFMAANNYPWSGNNAGALQIQTSKDGETWTNVGSEIALTSKTWEMFTVNMPAGTYMVGFKGYYVKITDIYGGVENSAAPDPTLTVSESDIDFGKVNAAAEKTFTVTSNVDTDVTVTIDGDNVFTVDAPATLKANQAATVTVKMNATANGEYAAVVTVKAGELTEIVNVAGQFKAAGEKFYEDFESYATGKVKESDLPGWEKDLTETSSSSEYYGKLNFYDGNLYYYSVNDESVYVITPKLYVSGTDDVLTINDYYLKGSNVAKIAVSYSADKENWTQLKTLYYYDMVSSGSKTHTFTGVPEGNWFVKFELCDAALCDVEGFSTTLATATLNQAEAAALERGVQDVTLNYTIAKGKWGTIALPFDVEDVKTLGDVKVYEFTGYENGNIKLDVTTKMEAGKPYVIYANAAISEAIELNNVNITATEAAAVEFNGAKFQATYAPLAAGSMEGKYGVAPTGKIQKGSAKASMKGFRGFFELPTNAQNARLLINGEEVTGIEAIENAESADVVFDLQGRRVAQPTKGLYIIGGKKMMVK